MWRNDRQRNYGTHLGFGGAPESLRCVAQQCLAGECASSSHGERKKWIAGVSERCGHQGRRRGERRGRGRGAIAGRAQATARVGGVRSGAEAADGVARALRQGWVGMTIQARVSDTRWLSNLMGMNTGMIFYLWMTHIPNLNWDGYETGIFFHPWVIRWVPDILLPL
jgi:hypothetical protein